MKPTEYPHYHPNYDALPPCQGFTLVNSARPAVSNDSCGGPNNDRRTTFRTPQERRQRLMQILESAIAIMDEDLMIEESFTLGRHPGGSVEGSSSSRPPSN